VKTDIRIRGVCCCIFEKKTGLLLRVMPNGSAAGRWIRKHYPDSPDEVVSRRYRSVAGIRSVFDDQMQVGLTALREIDDLLWYGCVSTDWKGPQANRQGKPSYHKRVKPKGNQK